MSFGMTLQMQLRSRCVDTTVGLAFVFAKRIAICEQQLQQQSRLRAMMAMR
jgi:hypothetical protein